MDENSVQVLYGAVPDILYNMILMSVSTPKSTSLESAL